MSAGSDDTVLGRAFDAGLMQHWREIKALLEFAVLEKADFFIGSGYSSMSMAISQRRKERSLFTGEVHKSALLNSDGVVTRNERTE